MKRLLKVSLLHLLDLKQEGRDLTHQDADHHLPQPLKAMDLDLEQVLATNMSKQKKIPKGVGDSIAKFLEVTGVQKVVKSTVKDCGCKKRQEKLNKLFPYK